LDVGARLEGLSWRLSDTDHSKYHTSGLAIVDGDKITHKIDVSWDQKWTGTMKFVSTK
jgi:hypothetical protein